MHLIFGIIKKKKSEFAVAVTIVSYRYSSILMLNGCFSKVNLLYGKNYCKNMQFTVADTFVSKRYILNLMLI